MSVRHSYIKYFHDIFTCWLVIQNFNKIWNFPHYLWNPDVGSITCRPSRILKHSTFFLLKIKPKQNASLQTWVEQFLFFQEGTYHVWAQFPNYRKVRCITRNNVQDASPKVEGKTWKKPQVHYKIRIQKMLKFTRVWSYLNS